MVRELRLMFGLAWPVMLAELGWITMGIVDTVMVRRLGPAAIGAVGTGSTLFIALMVLGIGTLFALDTFVSQSYGAKRLDECHRWLFAGLQLACVLSVIVVALSAGLVLLLPYGGVHPEVLALLSPYLWRLLWSAPPLLAYTVFRRYLQSMDRVRPVMMSLVSANLVNLAANWLLVYGHWGFPAMGVVGSAYATVIARIYLALFLLVVILMREGSVPARRKAGLTPSFGAIVKRAFARLLSVDSSRIWQLVKLGVPAALQIALEVGVFAAASMLAARITPLALAAHQIVLNVASFFFMIPLGINSAAAVRVGQAVGRGDGPGVRLAGAAALTLAAGFAAVMSVFFIAAPGLFLRIFTQDETLLRIGATVLFICAISSPLDACQTVATGALRGLGDTRMPMILNLAGHWGIGLPVAYVLCFQRGWGVAGLWTGLALGLFLIGAALVGVWRYRSARWA